MLPPPLDVPPCVRWATAPIVAHGLTDLCEPAALPVYAVGLFAPGADALVLAGAASVAHFARDMGGWLPSLLAHAGWALLAWIGRARLATASLYAFMAAVHVPRHLRGKTARARALACGTGALGALAWRPARVPLAAPARRLVFAHVVHERLAAARARRGDAALRPRPRRRSPRGTTA